MIRQDEGIKGVEMWGEEHKIGLLVDDIWIYLTHPNESFLNTISFLEYYGKFSRYKINVEKTQILTINYSPQQKIRDTYGTNSSGTKIIICLGVIITKKIGKLYETNYSKLNQDIKKDLTRWIDIGLDLSSRVEVIKINILPQLLYLIQSLPLKNPQKLFIEWDKWISRLIWNGKKPRVRYKTLKLPKDRGSLGLPGLKEHFCATQIRPLLLVQWRLCFKMERHRNQYKRDGN